jgi:hypothetical protein
VWGCDRYGFAVFWWGLDTIDALDHRTTKPYSLTHTPTRPPKHTNPHIGAGGRRRGGGGPRGHRALRPLLPGAQDYERTGEGGQGRDYLFGPGGRWL